MMRVGHTRGVRRIVLAGAQPGLIRDEVIEAMRAQQEKEGHLRLPIMLPQFAAGQAVRIASGPFEAKSGSSRQ
jgi:transcription antitermination factor NusG